MPLVVEDLVKTFKGGLRAVDGVSFDARPGQVVGLLGPNGAGKTTVLRMLVGLIRPDSGSVYVTGEPVHAGADVLGTVGAFIEGPGFLPHLTGMENLLAYWAATGRPLEEFPQPAFRQFIERAWGEAVERRAPTHEFHNDVVDGHRRDFETVRLPLADDGETVDMLLVASVHRRWSPSMAV